LINEAARLIYKLGERFTGNITGQNGLVSTLSCQVEGDKIRTIYCLISNEIAIKEKNINYYQTKKTAQRAGFRFNLKYCREDRISCADPLGEWGTKTVKAFVALSCGQGFIVFSHLQASLHAPKQQSPWLLPKALSVLSGRQDSNLLLCTKL
jgi:hypothetical protein